MVEMVERFKQHASDISEVLRKDAPVIEKIGKKQDDHLDSLGHNTNRLKKLIKSQQLGFFQLLAMAIIGIALWIFGIFFIILI